MTAKDRVRHAAARFLADPSTAPLLEWWRIELENAALPPGPVDPLRLAMMQGDRERLLRIRVLAGEAKPLPLPGESEKG